MNKTILITGGNKGIGLELTKIFLEKEYKVIVLARDFTNFEFTKHPNIKNISFDLENTEEIPELINRLGHIDTLINNAGIMLSIPFDEYPESKVQQILKINIESPIALIREVSKSMVKNKSGRIVNVASIAGQIGHPDIWYGITKAGLINATKSFSKSLGPLGVVINAVAPSPVTTNMLKVIPEERLAIFKNSVINKRFADPKEVADTIAWLATDSPEYINGTCIDLNNGSFPR